ncbi:unnamed protein product [Phyllotreta striolata]|uniref:Lipase domain-containing protein n=1 Tax=Phyllotreta striolata TaxID=444603 RepID=A0A9N9TQH5_PHYSR|nr:unnamed protein product [Phyllotreta striolata]
MKLLILITSFSTVLSLLNDAIETQDSQLFFVYLGINEEIQVEQLLAPIDSSFTSNDIIYYFYSKSNPTNGIKIRSYDSSAVRFTSFDNTKRTIFSIHGWKNNATSDVNNYIKDNVLKNHDVNVFVVDWGAIADKNYISAKECVPGVGAAVASFIKELISKYGLSLDRLTIAGHSLGAHVSGCAGKALNSQVDTIVGLDPAGPLYSALILENRLDKYDARFVQIIHTNAGQLGFDGNLGDADFYPNGGKTQPYCNFDVTGSCSHGRSYRYYAESFNNDNFVARKCDDYLRFESDKCDGRTSVMGTISVDKSATGEYYLNTLGEEPWAEG